MRDDIKTIATQLLIMHGYRGLRFSDIAEALGTTRANIHYHFGTKENLVEEVIANYVDASLEELRENWSGPSASFRDKVFEMMEFNRRRHARYNAPNQGGRPWSLISRMRLEQDLLTDTGRTALSRFSKAISVWIDEAVRHAQRGGEITADAPVKDIAVQLIAIVDSAGSITMDAGSFARLEHLYTAYMRIITHAYGGRPATRDLEGVAN